jgi:hypothetical protein
MPNKRMEFPKLPELDDDKLTPFQRFRILAKRVVSVPKSAVQEPKKDTPQPQ